MERTTLNDIHMQTIKVRQQGRGKAKQMEIKFFFYFIQILKTAIQGYNQFAKV